MLYRVDDGLRRKAKNPHELAMVNLLLFNLLVCVALLASTLAPQGSVLSAHKGIAVISPLSISLAIIAFTFVRTQSTKSHAAWFVAAHWQLATRRYRILLVAYLVGAALIGLGWLLSLTNPKLQELMFLAFLRVAVAPMLIAVMATAVLESGSIYQAGRGEVPDVIVKRFPPPADVVAETSSG